MTEKKTGGVHSNVHSIAASKDDADSPRGRARIKHWVLKEKNHYFCHGKCHTVGFINKKAIEKLKIAIAQCTCSYDESEEMTCHAPLCALSKGK